MAQNPPRSVLIALSPALSDRVLELGAFLERFGFSVGTATTANEVLVVCGKKHVDSAIFDLALTRDLGVDTWLKKLKLISPQTGVIALGDFAELQVLRETAQTADGEYSLLPLSPGEIKRRLRLLIESQSQAAAPIEQASSTDSRGLHNLVGNSAPMEAIRERIRKVAGLTSTVLITGESGVGKELIARAIHKASLRRDEAFIAINCSALPEALLESELFGHERGAFTGAATTSKGKFELAHGGTLFLDEIGDMNPYTQAKILRVLEEKEFMRVGGSRNIRVDVRLVAATNAKLLERMADGRFREDLYYRLKVLTIEVPPLRDRAEDIPQLVRSFLDAFARTNKTTPKRVTDETLSHLTRYRWPGNIRELRNALENLIVSAPGEVIDVIDLPPSLLHSAQMAPGATGLPRATGGPHDAGLHREIDRRPPASATTATPLGSPGIATTGSPLAVASTPATALLPSSMEDMERELIQRVLAEVGGNRTNAARVLKIGVRTLQRKIKRFGLDQEPNKGLLHDEVET